MEKQKVITHIEKGCIYCLRYFGIFNYPLTSREILYFNPYPSRIEEIDLAMENLIQKKETINIGEYYMLSQSDKWIDERELGHERAVKLLNKSPFYVSLIASFPFVRGIAISGSLSKFYASEKTDIDYFIITDENRLWIARTLLHLFKKLTFISGHQHYFCMNYLIDVNALPISSMNYYSAVETVTLLPAYNAQLLKKFRAENEWVNDFLPNYPTELNNDFLIKNRKRPLKFLFEGLFKILMPDKLNRYLMRLTDKKWRKKWANHGYSDDDYNRAFQTEISISKNHPADFEKKVLTKMDDVDYD